MPSEPNFTKLKYQLRIPIARQDIEYSGKDVPKTAFLQG